MKAEAGWSAAALVAVAAFVGISSQPGGRSVGDGQPERAAGSRAAQSAVLGASNSFERGPCIDLEEKIQTFLLASPEGVAAPSSCYDEATEQARSSDASRNEVRGKALRDAASDLQFMIAIVPDPLHTHFALSFDRQTEAIQQGAQDEKFLYDSSWMPWETEDPSLVLLSDQDKLDDRKKAREEQPGILLFRNGQPGKLPYRNGLVVFVVGEEATSGIHKKQFANAVEWIDALRLSKGNGPPVKSPEKPRASKLAKDSSPAMSPVEIIGPSFSGSLASLAQLLTEEQKSNRLQGFYAADGQLKVYSGGVSSDGAVSHFVESLRGDADDPSPVKVKFRSFQESDETAIFRYRSYLSQAGFDMGRLAIISEDETAFGGYADLRADTGAAKNAPDPLCGALRDEKGEPPTCLYYPRDISALRDAYQKQSIFSAGSSQSQADSAQHTLSANLADPEGQQHDAIRSYSGNQTPLSEEAVLQQVVSMLHVHRSQYIVLRSSNPLDQLFLSHYLRLAYPEGRVVIQGADLLLRRESGAATLSGIMTLTTYPLLPWSQHWSRIGDSTVSHSHKVFPQDGSEGTYIATRALLDPKFDGSCSKDLPGISSGEPPRSEQFLPANCSETPIRDYLPPWWAAPKCGSDNGNDRNCPAARRPSTWLSVLGRGGFWPVAALNDATVPAAQSEGKVASIPSWVDWPPTPLSMKICMGILFLLAVFHLYCCSTASLTVKPGYRAHFVRIAGWSHPSLILLGSVALAAIPTLLVWGMGAMSQHDEPVPEPEFYWAIIASIWSLGAAAVWTNGWNERRLALRDGAKRTGAPPWLYLIAFVAATAAFYLLVDWLLEGALNAADRVPAFWRSMNLTNGVSPLVPLLALAAGIYCWFWYSLQGLALFGERRPMLPTQHSLQIEREKDKDDFLSMYSGERMGRSVEGLCLPFSLQACCVFAASFVILLLVGWLLADGEVPIRSLGATHYARFYCIGVDVVLSLVLANCWQLMAIWLRLRQLLMFLDRLPLRRTMCALRSYSWGSLWQMGGNILDVRYKLLYRQFESFTHLCSSLRKEGSLENHSWSEEMGKTQDARRIFAKWYSAKWDVWDDRNVKELSRYQHSVARSAGLILATLLVPRWREEEKSLVTEDSGNKSVTVKISKNKSARLQSAAAQQESRDPEDSPAFVSNAEELVCLVYLGFVQNILGRMRTLVMQIALLFIAATISVATYPFDPRPALSGAMLVMFLILGFVVATVYAQMSRDATLSHVTNTNPGELGTEFWFKLIGFGLGPALGLLATLFPELPGSLLSWIQPGASMLK